MEYNPFQHQDQSQKKSKACLFESNQWKYDVYKY